MCTIDKIANVVKGAATVARVVIPAVNSYNAQKDTLNYRTTLAINNMKEAKKEGQIQQQTGIEESRKQKLKGLQSASELMAQNAASGFSVDSGNSYLGYEDSLNDSYQNAYDIEQAYNVRADNYFEKANSYLNEAKSYQKERKSLKRNVMQSALGNSTQVAKRWFS